MQDQNTPAEAGTPAPARGRHILTAVLDGTSDAISAFMGRFGAAASSAQVDIAGVESLGPLPPDHPAQQLPTIPPMDSAAASGVVVDPGQSQQAGQPDAQVEGAASSPNAASNPAEQSAGNPNDDDATGVSGVAPSVDQGADAATGEQPAEQSSGGGEVADSRDRTGGVVGGAVQDGAAAGAVAGVDVHEGSAEGSPSVSAAGTDAPGGPSGPASSADSASGEIAPTSPAAPEEPSASQIAAAIDAGMKLLILGGDTTSAMVLAFLGHAAAQLDPQFDPLALNAALVAAVGALDQIGDSVSGDVISRFGAQLFPESWKLPLVFDPPAPAPDSPVSSQPALVGATSSAAAPSAEATAPIGSPVEGSAVQLVDPSPHPDPASVNPNAR